MAKRDTLWNCVGITEHKGDSNTVVKTIRYGMEFERSIKLAQIDNRTKSMGECLHPVRVEFIRTPSPMSKKDALEYALTASEFQSIEDQVLIKEKLKKLSNTSQPVNKKKRILTAEDLLKALQFSTKS